MSQCYTDNTMTDDDKLLLENQACFPLYSAANAVIRAYRPLLDELDLTGLVMPEIQCGAVGPDARALGGAAVPLAMRFLTEQGYGPIVRDVVTAG